MFQKVMTVALAVLVALGSLALAAAQEPKQTGSKTKSPPKELTVDLGKGVTLELLPIPAGEFLMGLPEPDKSGRADERPQHRVRITKPFWLGKYLVTQEQWQAVVGNNPSEFKGPKNPVDSAGWEDCREFLKKLNETFAHTGLKASLPTEAQWEYACRAGSKTRYYYGDEEANLAEYTWFNDNSQEKTHPVGGKKPNAWGLYDMHGNLFQSANSSTIDFISGLPAQVILYVSCGERATWTSRFSTPPSSQTYVTFTGLKPPWGCR